MEVNLQKESIVFIKSYLLLYILCHGGFEKYPFHLKKQRLCDYLPDTHILNIAIINDDFK